jgi:signal transduction histidine kinase
MAEATTADWLERANRLALTSALLSTTVHEVNNALQVISGSAEMLSPSSAPDLIARRADAIGAHARRASALLAELSSFAKNESTSLMTIDLGQTANRALSMRKYTIAKLKLESSFETAGEARTIIAQSRALLQLVLNLIINAEQALARKGGGRIALRVQGDPATVLLVVEDDGPGMSAEDERQLFAPRTQAVDGRLGIGLTVARQLADRFSGTLSYAPRPGGGCRFTATFPAAR